MEQPAVSTRGPVEQYGVECPVAFDYDLLAEQTEFHSPLELRQRYRIGQKISGEGEIGVIRPVALDEVGGLVVRQKDVQDVVPYVGRNRVGQAP